MSACTPIDRLMQTLRVEAPGAPDPTIELQLFNTIDFFFRRTSAWREPIEVQLQEGIINYDFLVPEGAEVVRLMAVEHNGVPVMPAPQVATVAQGVGVILPDLTFPDGDAVFNPAVSDINTGTGLFTFAVYRPTVITIAPSPSTDDVKYPLKAIMALTISRGCLECDCGDWQLPDWMFDMFFEEWLTGTLSRLFMMPSKPWTSAPLAVTYGRRFRDRMAYRKQEAARGFTYNVPAWRFPRGWT